MGKTVESYRIALDMEIQKWSGFSRALRIEDREAFEQITDACRNHASGRKQRNATRDLRVYGNVNPVGTTEEDS
jgi:hypothetical protein